MEEQTEQNDNQSLLGGVTPKEATLHKLTTDKDGNNIWEEVKPILNGLNKPTYASLYEKSVFYGWKEQHERLKKWVDLASEKEAEYKGVVTVFRSKYEKEYGFRVIMSYFIDWLDSRFGIVDFCELKEHDILYQLHEYCKQLRAKYERAERNEVIEENTPILLDMSKNEAEKYTKYVELFESEKHRLICEEVLTNLRWIEHSTLKSKKNKKDKKRFLVFAQYFMDKGYLKANFKINKVLPIITNVYCGEPSPRLDFPVNRVSLENIITKELNNVLQGKAGI